MRLEPSSLYACEARAWQVLPHNYWDFIAGGSSKKGVHGLRHLLEIIRKIAQVLHSLEEHRHPVSIHIPTAGIHQGAFGWTQERVLDEFFMGIRRSARWIIAGHTHLTATPGRNFPEVPEPAVLAGDFGGQGGMSG